MIKNKLKLNLTFEKIRNYQELNIVLQYLYNYTTNTHIFRGSNPSLVFNQINDNFNYLSLHNHDKHGIHKKIRSDATMCILGQINSNFLFMHSLKKYNTHLQWGEIFHEFVNNEFSAVVSFILHVENNALPRIYYIFIPIDTKGKLNASFYIGDKQKLKSIYINAIKHYQDSI